ncbi:MAG: GspMb/PilO family protein [Lentisphaeria bacterium]|jgi:hypothetical protein
MSMTGHRLTYRDLAGLALFSTLAFAAAGWILLQPRRNAVAEARGTVHELQNRLAESGYPLDSERLAKLAEENRRRAEALSRQSDEILRQATALFDRRIKTIFETNAKFRSEVSRLDFQDEFTRTEEAFRGRGIHLAEGVSNLSMNSAAPNYQLVLQVWTLKELVDLAAGSGLTIARDPLVRVAVPGEGGDRPAAKLSVRPMRAYTIHKGGRQPYLLEFPVRLTVWGRLENLCRFLESLQAGGRFLPVSRLEIQVQAQSVERGGSPVMEATFECSSFYRLDEGEAEAARPGRENRALPHGA